MERVLGLNESLVDSFTRQQATPEASSSDTAAVTTTHSSPSRPKTGHLLTHLWGHCFALPLSHLACRFADAVAVTACCAYFSQVITCLLFSESLMQDCLPCLQHAASKAVEARSQQFCSCLKFY